jgi:hypothetical protein
MSNKQTAVEWLISELTEYNLMNKYILPSHPIFKKAKEMEKQQIECSFADGFVEGVQTQKSGEQLLFPKQYYTETYGGQNNEQ